MVRWGSECLGFECLAPFWNDAFRFLVDRRSLGFDLFGTRSK
ncbi:hypothetical protein RRSWK_00357 [Rhodopirellula sp. SWK7]|nr:hypothetical protein RRSWK_00357 [Rhodopirellula sp. SWK7]